MSCVVRGFILVLQTGIVIKIFITKFKKRGNLLNYNMKAINNIGFVIYLLVITIISEDSENLDFFFTKTNHKQAYRIPTLWSEHFVAGGKLMQGMLWKTN